ncbi:MAG: hypothetical protein Q9184_001567 [Pyrenodesmia sp. 2 TL-2023]
MSAPEPDLERGDSALKVPANPYALPPPSLQSTKPTANAKPQHSPLNGSKPSPQSPPRRRRQSQHRPLSKLTHDPNAVPPKLQKLRTIIGISTPESLAASPSSKNPFARPAPNLGIYARIVAEERTARFQFYFAASVINTCYFMQIVVAAALTALGASSASNIAITVLGATNTVIAGILTYLKGQGLPNRLRMYWNGLRKCREYIEEKERECAAEGWSGEGEEASMDVEKEIETIVKMYHDVRQTAEDNTPDTYLPMQGNSASLLARAKSTVAATPNGSVRYPGDDDEEDEEDVHPDRDDDHGPRMSSPPLAASKPAEAPKANGPEATATMPAAGSEQANGAVKR